MFRKSWIRSKQPTAPIKVAIAIIRDVRGSVRRANRDSEVKTLAVSSVPLRLFCAKIE